MQKVIVKSKDIFPAGIIKLASTVADSKPSSATKEDKMIEAFEDIKDIRYGSLAAGEEWRFWGRKYLTLKIAQGRARVARQREPGAHERTCIECRRGRTWFGWCRADIVQNLLLRHFQTVSLCRRRRPTH